MSVHAIRDTTVKFHGLVLLCIETSIYMRKSLIHVQPFSTPRFIIIMSRGWLKSITQVCRLYSDYVSYEHHTLTPCPQSDGIPLEKRKQGIN